MPENFEHEKACPFVWACFFVLGSSLDIERLFGFNIFFEEAKKIGWEVMSEDVTGWRGTTILTVRKGGKVVIAGDGQVSLGQTVIKGNARKVRTLHNGEVISGFAGATADAFTLFERLEGKLEQYSGQLLRACVEMAKDWRTDRYLRKLEAMMIVADRQALHWC